MKKIRQNVKANIERWCGNKIKTKSCKDVFSKLVRVQIFPREPHQVSVVDVSSFYLSILLPEDITWGSEKEKRGKMRRGNRAIKPIYIPQTDVLQGPVVPVPGNIVRPLSYLQQSAIKIGLMTCALHFSCLWQVCVRKRPKFQL